jgi:hypothetical protein
MTKIRLTIAIVAALSVLVLPAAAFANSGQSGYSGPNSAVAGINSSGGNGPTSGSPSPVVEEVPTVAAAEVESSGSSLPFTGLDVGYVAGAGILLLGVGLLLRRATHRGDLAG